MQQQGRIIIVGAGIAGLCSAVYARHCGCQTVVLERDTAPGRPAIGRFQRPLL